MNLGFKFWFGFWVGKATNYLSRLSQCLSWSRIMKHVGKCSLFVYLSCMHPRFAWMPSVSIVELLVCQLGSLSRCIHHTWYQRSKDHSHLEQNCAFGINHDLGVPTKTS